MFTLRTRKSAVMMLACASIPTSGFAQSVILRSTGPSAETLSKGTILPNEAQIKLFKGDEVTVLDNIGTRTLKGPGSFSIDAKLERDAPSNRLAIILTAMLTSDGRPRVVAAAIRGFRFDVPRKTDGKVTPQPRNQVFNPRSNGAQSDDPEFWPGNFWEINAENGGTYCVTASSKLNFSRPGDLGDRTVLLSSSDGSQATLKWKNGVNNIAWPIDLVPLYDGTTYKITHPDQKTSMIKIISINGIDEKSNEAIYKIDQEGCHYQFDSLLKALSYDESISILDEIGGAEDGKY